jgi:hypothetical protein
MEVGPPADHKARFAIGINEDHLDVAYISSRLGTAGLVNKLLGRTDVDADPSDNLIAKFQRLRQRVNPGDLVAWTRSSSSTPRRWHPIQVHAPGE